MTEHFVKIPDSIVRGGILTPIEAAVYSNLLSHQGLNESAWPSHRKIANETRISTSSVRRAIAQLIKYELVSKQHCFESDGKQTSNHYFVKDASGWSHRQRAMVSMNDKEDSIKEDSSKTSTRLMKRDWTRVSPDKAPTAKQLATITDYISRLEVESDLFDVEDSRWDAPGSREEAHQQIRSLHIELARNEMFR